MMKKEIWDLVLINNSIRAAGLYLYTNHIYERKLEHSKHERTSSSRQKQG
jgi:hypothetical protein